MKNLLIIFVSLICLTWAEEKELKNYTACALEGFQEFKVFAFLPCIEKINQQSIYNAIVDSLKKHGQVLVTEKASIFEHLPNLNQQNDTLFFIAIDKDGEQLKGSIDVMAEVEIQKNKQKTGCTIWKKNLSTWIPKEQEHRTEQAISNLINKMVDEFSEHLKTSNPNSKPTIFHVQKYQEL